MVRGMGQKKHKQYVKIVYDIRKKLAFKRGLLSI